MNKIASVVGIVVSVLGGIAAIIASAAGGKNSEPDFPVEKPIIPKKNGQTRYIVQRVDAYTGKVLETEDEVFDNEEDAESYLEDCSAGFAQGEEDLEYANRAFDYAEDSYFVVTEIED